MSQLAIVLHYHDLRTSDHPALSSLANAGYEILPIFVYDEVNLRRLGGASKWWLNYAMQRLISDYKNLGHDFQLVRDDTFSVLRELVENNENKDENKLSRKNINENSLGTILASNIENLSILCSARQD